MKQNIIKKNTGLHRLLHWTIALSMTILFITGFLRMYWMGKKTIIKAIENGIPPESQLSQNQMKGIAKEVLEPMWQWHEYAAYLMFILFSARILYMLFKGIRFPRPFSGASSMKERLQGWSYIGFYLFTAISIFTGFYLKWIDGEWAKQLETVHKWAIYWFPIFILMHCIGILMEEFSGRKGITSRMIGGD